MYQTIFLTVFIGIVIIVQATSHNETIERKVRFLDGEHAKPGDFPYMVSVQQYREGYQFVLNPCGGVILRSQWILTAAQCVKGHVHGDRYLVKAGLLNLFVPEKDAQVVMVKKVIEHEQYRTNGFEYNIALVKLERELQMNAKVQAIALPGAFTPSPGPNDTLSMAGWGIRCYCDAPITKRLYGTFLSKRDIHLIDPKKYKEHAHCKDTNLCAPCGIYFHCMDDAGGPLVGKGGMLVGIISYNDDCCLTRTTPQLFIRVSKFTEWIKGSIDAEPNSNINSRGLPQPTKANSSSKRHLANLLIPFQIWSLFGILH